MDCVISYLKMKQWHINAYEDTMFALSYRDSHDLVLAYVCVLYLAKCPSYFVIPNHVKFSIQSHQILPNSLIFLACEVLPVS